MKSDILTHPYFEQDSELKTMALSLLNRFKNITGLETKDIITYRQVNTDAILVNIKSNREYRAANIHSIAAKYYFQYKSPTQWLLHAIDERSVK